MGKLSPIYMPFFYGKNDDRPCNFGVHYFQTKPNRYGDPFCLVNGHETQILLNLFLSHLKRGAYRKTTFKLTLKLLAKVNDFEP